MFNLFYRNSPLKINLAVVLVVTIIFLSGGWGLLYPKPAQAIISTIPSDIARDAIKLIWSGVQWAYDKAAAAYRASAAWITALAKKWEKSQSILAQAARIAAQLLLNQVLAMLTNQIIEWIQGGGEPQFVSNWGDFLSDAADKAGGLFVEKYLGAGYLCKPFDISVKIALLPVPTFEERVKCSISDIVTNINDFANDFSQGGWKGWIELTKPQNNFYGGYLTSRDEKLKQADEAREAALKEAESAGGFLSVKACVKGNTEDDDGNIGDNCSDKDSCKSLKESNPGSFYCSEEKVVTPGSVLSDITSETVNQPLNLLREQIADLTSSMGIAGPFITAIANALSNRVIKEGLAYVTSSGPTIDDPNTPLPSGTPIPPVDRTPVQAVEDQADTTILIAQQKLLKENLEDQLLPQQQSNLGVLQSIETIQNSILSTLVDILIRGCSLPSGASSQIISTTSNLDADGEGTITEIINITKSDVGSVRIEKVTTISEDDEGDLQQTYSYQIQEISPQITSQKSNLEADIAETNQWIADTASAIASGNGYIQTATEYLTLYETTLQPPTTAEQALIDEKKALLQAAKNLVLSNGKIAAKTTEDQNLMELTDSTQYINMGAIQEMNNLFTARGASEVYPEVGTLYAQKKSVRSALNQAQNYLSSCSDDSNGD